ncbi:hypothetical protein AVEN_275335-1 [Araneus ventricosus]|uniref:Uncharacterized protein n=1 Tax=Araneus ventricosus TaxID=182803 RepID=A0A4Y2KV71_ARAVE|nr:hypothetical protein AVEN_275335-1 [Araneus ventricosus]
MGSFNSFALPANGGEFSTRTSKNQLQISAEKTNCILISKLVRGPTIRWQGARIKRAHAIKYLGVYIDEKMNWNTHLKAQSTRTTQLYQNLLKIAGKSWGVPLNHRRPRYKTVIERVLAHGAVAWCLEPTSESPETQQFNVRSSWQSRVPTGPPPRQLCRSY